MLVFMNRHVKMIHLQMVRRKTPLQKNLRIRQQINLNLMIPNLKKEKLILQIMKNRNMVMQRRKRYL